MVVEEEEEAEERSRSVVEPVYNNDGPPVEGIDKLLAERVVEVGWTSGVVVAAEAAGPPPAVTDAGCPAR